MCRMTFKAMATAVLCGWALMLSAPVLRAAVKLPQFTFRRYGASARYEREYLGHCRTG
jgi:hypothetical protein